MSFDFILGELFSIDELVYIFTFLIISSFVLIYILKKIFLNLTLKSFYITFFFFEFVIISTLVYKIVVLDHIESKLVLTNSNTIKMIKLANVLKDSSNDLTSFIRNYAVTKNKEFKQNYLNILDIRDGKIQRPKNYSSVYWNLEKSIREKKHPLGHRISFKDEVNSLPFSKKEKDLLLLSEKKSNNLAKLELKAIKEIKNNRQKEAIKILYSKQYYLEKSKIMLPIDEMIHSLDNRTSKEIAFLNKKIKNQFRDIFIISLIFILGNIYLYFIFRNKISKPISYLTKIIKYNKEDTLINKKKYFSKDEIGFMIKEFFLMNKEIKKRNSEIKEVKLNLENVSNTLTNIIAYKDKDLKYTGVNKAFCEFFQVKEADVIGKTDTQLFPWFFSYEEKQLLKNRSMISYEKMMNDRMFYIEKHTLVDSNDNIYGIVVNAKDIHEQKQLEENLSSSKKHFKALFDSSPDSIILLKDEQIIDYNEQAVSQFKINRDEKLSSYSVLELSPVFQSDNMDSRRLFFEKTHEVMDFGYSHFEWKYLQMPDKTIFEAEVIFTKVVLESQTYIYAVIRDITQRKKLENRISILNQLVYGSLESANVGAWWIDLKDKKTFYALDTTAKLLDIEAFDEQNHSYYLEDWYHLLFTTRNILPKYKKLIDDAIHSFDLVLEGKSDSLSVSYPIVNNSNEIKWLDARAEVLQRDEDNFPLLLTGTLIDITDLKKAEEGIVKVNKNFSDSISYASLIQHSLIPNEKELKPYFSDSFCLWQPKDVVGGDIYLFTKLRSSDESLLMMIDCTGHGVPGAFVTMLVKAIEQQIIGDILSSKKEVSPSEILKYFNKTIKKLLKQESLESKSNAGFDGGIFYYNKKQNIVKYAGANTPLFYVKNDEVNIIKGNRQSIGYKKSDSNYEFDEHVISIDETTYFYLCTDGYLDQVGGNEGFCFGKERFSKLLQSQYRLPFEEQKVNFLNSLERYQGLEDRVDDITLCALKIDSIK